MPIRTKTIAARSISERGRSAERIPTGSASSIQKTAPPKTSEAVTGAASQTMSFTSWRLTNDVPSELSPTSCQTKRPYCCLDRLVEMRAAPRPRSTSAGVAPWPAASRAGSDGVM